VWVFSTRISSAAQGGPQPRERCHQQYEEEEADTAQFEKEGQGAAALAVEMEEAHEAREDLCTQCTV